MRFSHRFSPRFSAAALAAISLSLVPAHAAAKDYAVIIDKLKFGPVPAHLTQGDDIVWQNRDFLRHSATAADHSFDVDLPAGATARTVLRKSGQIAFSCRYHPGMRGVLNVGPAAARGK